MSRSCTSSPHQAPPWRVVGLLLPYTEHELQTRTSMLITSPMFACFPAWFFYLPGRLEYSTDINKMPGIN
jgi:hypothetical protein